MPFAVSVALHWMARCHGDTLVVILSLLISRQSAKLATVTKYHDCLGVITSFEW